MKNSKSTILSIIVLMTIVGCNPSQKFSEDEGKKASVEDLVKSSSSDSDSSSGPQIIDEGGVDIILDEEEEEEVVIVEEEEEEVVIVEEDEEEEVVIVEEEEEEVVIVEEDEEEVVIVEEEEEEVVIVEEETPNYDPGQVEVVVNKCATQELTTETLTIVFEEQKNVCEWGQNGNLEKYNTKMQARLEETKTLNIPEGATICEMGITSTNQTVKYDDHLLFALNDSVIFASYPKHVSKMYVDGKSAPQYSWENLVGMGFDNNESQRFCLGSELGSFCTIPQTQVSGKFEVSVVPEKIKEIMSYDLERKSHELKLITTGDNDSRTDCKHTRIEVQVNVTLAQ